MTIEEYHQKLPFVERLLCEFLFECIQANSLPFEPKVWHGHPVWFHHGNPIVGYSHQKKGIRLMFWSGADFEEESLNVHGGKFKDASIFFTFKDQIHPEDISRWLLKGLEIQWDYKNIVKRKGQLVRI